LPRGDQHRAGERRGSHRDCEAVITDSVPADTASPWIDIWPDNVQPDHDRRVRNDRDQNPERGKASSFGG
jgi:hypothetical protein